MKIVYDRKSDLGSEVKRVVIPNDTKMFAQADLDSTIESYVSADIQAKKVIALLSNEEPLNFKYIDISTPYNQIFGELF